MQNSLVGFREQGGRTGGGGGREDMVLLSSCLQVHGTDICDSNSVWLREKKKTLYRRCPWGQPGLKESRLELQVKVGSKEGL